MATPRKPLPTRNAVLDVLASEDRPLHTNEIAERLGVAPGAYEGLLRLLDTLVFDGVVQTRGGQRFRLDKKAIRGKDKEEARHAPREGSPRERHAGKGGGGGRDRREGIVKVNPRGFGFVASTTAQGDDVFVSADALGGAMNGDKVVVEIIARGSRGAEGQIVEVLARATPRVSGILRRRGKSAWVEPDDPRVKGPVVLTSEVDLVGPEGNSGQGGEVVVVAITRYAETADENPEGKLVAVLGMPGELSVEVRKVLLLGGVEEVHDQQAIDEAESYGAEVPAAMLEGREDLTHIPLPTIDPDDARDHDDAVWVERTASGGYEVWVAIADVSSYVRPGMKLDEEAEKRGCSIYLPDRAIPMLPRALSSNLCSLLPDVIRLCLCVHAELDAKGHVKKTRLIRGYMKSAAKLTYGGVARALGFSAEPPRQPAAEEMIDGLRVAYECSRLLRTRRMKRGALDFDLPEAVVKLDAEGKPTTIKKRAQDLGVKKAYQLIEELMIFANEVVARWLLERNLPGVYRVHLPPDPQKLDKLAAMCDFLGIELDVDDTQTPKGLADVLKSFADHPLAQVLNNLLLRSMKQAVYDVQNLGHFGLASEAYLHFTSPIRRYPDLVVHRICHAAIEQDKRAMARAGDMEKLTQAASQSSMAERRAMEIERETVDVYRCFYMLDKIGETYEGTVNAFVGSGAFVGLDDPFVDLMVRTEDMGPDFSVDDDGLTARGSRSGRVIRLGDKLLVKVVDAAILRRTVYGRLVGAADDDERGGFSDRGKNPRRAHEGKKGRVFSKPQEPRPGNKGRFIGNNDPRGGGGRGGAGGGGGGGGAGGKKGKKGAKSFGKKGRRR